MEPSHESVAIGGSFASQVSSTGIPLEIVDAENAQAAAGERNRQNVSADESMEMDTSTSAPPAAGIGVGSQTTGNGSQPPAGQMGGLAGRSAGGIATPSDQLSAAGGMEVSVGGSKPAAVGGNSGQPRVRDAAAQSAIEHFHQEVARSLGTAATGPLEVAPDSIVFPPSGQQSGGAGGGARVSADAAGPELMNAAKRILGGVNVSYGDLDLSGMNSSMDQSLEVSTLSTPKSARIAGGGGGGGAGNLNEPGSPSSVDSNFDSSELLNAEELQHDEMTSRLSRAGPIGLATAAAIMTGRKRKRQHIFESNPALRKRHCSKLVRKLKETIVELTARVGLQAAVVFYRPGKTDPKEEPSFKVFGASPLDSCLVNQKSQICSEMDAVLNQQVPLPPKEPELQAAGADLHELPPVMFDGIPTPVHKMTQAQLRAFIPNMLKYSTGRGKPGWGKEEMKPVWWPEDIPWQNVRSDMRTTEKKKEVPWTEGLRRIVISCYLHHGRLDLLPEFSLEHLPPISTETAQQIQLQLERLQQQHGGGGGVALGRRIGGNVVGVGGGGGEPMEGGGGDVMEHTAASNPQLGETGGGEVFTVDTGIGNCDNSGMPTLADATLAEAAAKLQQVADETGEVQYATHLVTVTEKDAKALGQPVGSTTTVLLTAYPGGHGGGMESGPDPSEQLISPPTTSANVPNVQVVYSASHIDSIPDNLVSSAASASSSTTAQLTQSTAATSAGPISIPAVVDQSVMGVAGGGATGGGGVAGNGEGVIPNSILGQSEVVTQIQGAMAEIQGQLLGGAAGIESAMLAGNAQQGSGPIPGQTSGNGSSAIQDAIIGQGGVVGGDSIQDSIQDSIMGQTAPVVGAAASILGQVGKAAGIQDSSQYLNPAAAGSMMTGGGGATSSGEGEGPTSVSDIASQLISQYVASTQSVPAPFQAPPTNTGVEQQPVVESMQTDVAPQSVETAIPPTVST